MSKYARPFARRKRERKMEKFYLTTAIAYASRKPHFGNTYEIIMTDAFARFQRQMGKDVVLCTGTRSYSAHRRPNSERLIFFSPSIKFLRSFFQKATLNRPINSRTPLYFP